MVKDRREANNVTIFNAKMMLCPMCQREALILELYKVCIPCQQKDLDKQKDNTANIRAVTSELAYRFASGNHTILYDNPVKINRNGSIEPEKFDSNSYL